MPIPKAVFSVLGNVPVVEGEIKKSLMGFFKPSDRKIYIQPGMHPETALQTLYHELIHLALYDAGVACMLGQVAGLEEAICDSLGTYFAAADRAGYLFVKSSDEAEPVPQATAEEEAPA